MSKKKSKRPVKRAMRPALQIAFPGFTVKFAVAPAPAPLPPGFPVPDGCVPYVIKDTLLVMNKDHVLDYLCPLASAELVSEVYQHLFGVTPPAQALRTAMVGLALGTADVVEFCDGNGKQLLGVARPQEGENTYGAEYFACDYTEGADPRVEKLWTLLAAAFSQEELLENVQRQAELAPAGTAAWA